MSVMRGPGLESVGVVELRCGTTGKSGPVKIPQPVAEVVPVVGVDEKEVVAGPDDPAEPGEESHQPAPVVVLDVTRKCGPGSELPASRKAAEIGGEGIAEPADVVAGQADVVSVESGREADAGRRSDRDIEVI